jgi:hypothetical protein
VSACDTEEELVKKASGMAHHPSTVVVMSMMRMQGLLRSND